MPRLLAHHGATEVQQTTVVFVICRQPVELPELSANPSSPEPRTKQLEIVRKFPTLLPAAPLPLLMFIPSAQVELVRLFLMMPLEPSAHIPAPKCCTQTLLITQLLPLTLSPPPLPSPLPPLRAFASKHRSCKVQEVG